MQPRSPQTQVALDELTIAARQLGLRFNNAHVLRNGANLVVHLAPLPVVARVATLTGEVRGGGRAQLERELVVTAMLGTRGIRVPGPTTLADPGPHQAGNHWFSLLERVELTPLSRDSDAYALRVAESFAELSRAMAEFPDSVRVEGDGHPWSEIARLLTVLRPTIPAQAAIRIVDVVRRLRGCEPGDQHHLVHGDAHRGNVGMSEGEIMWFDFEDANRRPLAWDVATLRKSWPSAGDKVCELLNVDPNSPSMMWHRELRDVYALLWQLFYAIRLPSSDDRVTQELEHWLAGSRDEPA